MPQLSSLPAEILLAITDHVTYWSDINALVNTNRRFYSLLNDELYHGFCEDLHEKFQLPLGQRPRHTVLDWAAQHGKALCLRRLFQAGLSPSINSPRSWHPMTLAATQGHVDIVRIYLEHGLDSTPRRGLWFKGGRPGYPLPWAITTGQVSVVRLLVESGQSVVSEHLARNTRQPLSMATLSHQVPMVKLLLELGCDPLSPDAAGGCAFSHAAREDLDVLKIFVDAGMDLVSLRPGCDEDDGGPLTRALLSNNVPLAEFLLEHGFEVQMQLNPTNGFFQERWSRHDIYTLVARMQKRRSSMVQIFWSQIDVDDVIENEYEHPIGRLMKAAATSGSEDLMWRLLETDLAAKNKVSPAVWKGGLSCCLGVAAAAGHVGIVKMLLEHDVHLDGLGDPDLRMGEYPPLLQAVDRGHTEIVELLLDRGASPYPPFCPSAIDRAVSCPSASDTKHHIIRLLLRRHLEIGDRDSCHSLVPRAVYGGEAILKMALQHLDIELQPDQQQHHQALSLAARLGDISIMRMLLDAGFDPTIHRDERAETLSLLFLAAKLDNDNPHKDCEKAVDLLLTYGADPEVEDPRTGLKPIYFLAGIGVSHPGRAEAAKLLLKKGADLFRISENGESVLVTAARAGHTPMVTMLLGYFDEQATPFTRINDMVAAAARATEGDNPKLARILWHYYWRRVYPCP
ncbi:uncharacterized protein N7459_009965 [Penicillium hispanicum]|uniref:uncharacterized protein n=1 Tax=Penicillium hispanicum TaxID=1080232 RepID=UPI0025408E9A|nr:uncharacterized protein N7459_009965 [Penicillium hispanicum]KAJ5570535.1 hypothetical protein N7459_009965 [Penicillium hispanicum]